MVKILSFGAGKFLSIEKEGEKNGRKRGIGTTESVANETKYWGERISRKEIGKASKQSNQGDMEMKCIKCGAETGERWKKLCLECWKKEQRDRGDHVQMIAERERGFYLDFE